MGALPKKKMCWNCDGNVSEEFDNCPYCGVYVQGTDWNKAYNPAQAEYTQEAPAPLYKISTEEEKNSSLEGEEECVNLQSKHVFDQLKKELLPTLFLMAGSSFLIFSLVLFLFTTNGQLTLQWSSSQAIYFLIAGLPFVAIGWKLLQSIEE